MVGVRAAGVRRRRRGRHALRAAPAAGGIAASRSSHPTAARCSSVRSITSTSRSSPCRATPIRSPPASRCGWHGDLDEAPAGFATELARVGGADAARRARANGSARLRQRAGTARPSRYADAGLARLSYWTDNGATYYYRTAPGLDCIGTLERAVADCEARGIPIELVQVDSWFYPQEHLRPVSDAGAPIVPPSGMMRWEPREDLFPEGFAHLRERLGHRPLAFHSRHFASASPYFRAARRRGSTAPMRTRAVPSCSITCCARRRTGAPSRTSRTGSSSRFSACAVCAPPRAARAQWQETLDHCRRRARGDAAVVHGDAGGLSADR